MTIVRPIVKNSMLLLLCCVVLAMNSCFIVEENVTEEREQFICAESEIVFISRRIEGSADYQVYIMKCDGSEERKLVDKVADCAGVSASPTGNKIAFIARENDLRNLYIVDRDGQNLTHLSSGKRSCGGAKFSSDGKRIVYFRDDPADLANTRDVNLYVIYIDGSNDTKITNGASNYSPSWVFNDSRILYTSQNDSACSIAMIDPDGSNYTVLSTQNRSFACPLMAPDETKIVFTSCDWSGSQIFVINPDGTDFRQLTNSVDPTYWDIGFPRKGTENPVWSADSKRIYYISYGNGYPSLLSMRPDGKDRQLLTNLPMNSFTRSPDGSYLMFDSKEDPYENPEIFVLSTLDKSIYQITDNSYQDAFPIWIE